MDGQRRKNGVANNDEVSLNKVCCNFTTFYFKKLFIRNSSSLKLLNCKKLQNWDKVIEETIPFGHGNP